jgi:organic radical activating enzyme
MNKETIAVAEHFLSVQGEGQTAGKRAYFLRLAGCNLMCGGKGTERDGQLHNGATWRCDSIEVWLKGKSVTFNQLVDDMGGRAFISNLQQGAHLIITGGEPLLQQDSIYDFIKYLSLDIGIPGLTVEIETNGTIMPSDKLFSLVKFWNVSPKLQNSGEPYFKRVKREVIEALSFRGPKTCFKFVVKDRADLLEIEKTYIQDIMYQSQVYLMAAADNRNELDAMAESIVGLALEFGYNYSHRIHISVWNQKTGV